MIAASDSELVARCRAGEAAAWDALVDRYARYVHAIVTRVYRLPPDDAEDVFQEVFARVFERLDTLRDANALRPGSHSSHGGARSTRCAARPRGRPWPSRPRAATRASRGSTRR